MSNDKETFDGDWALILGASSGFGEATALELASLGLNIFGVHLDRKTTLPNVERIVNGIRACGREAVFFNVNAADGDKRAEIVETIRSRVQEGGRNGGVRVLLHSLAFGTLKPFIPGAHGEPVSKPQMDMTLDVMANSLVYWCQDLLVFKLLRRGSRIFSMTSAAFGSGLTWASGMIRW